MALLVPVDNHLGRVQHFDGALKRPTETNNMDFIERIFRFAPDGGNGSFEVLLFAIPLAGIAFLALRVRRRMQRKQSRGAKSKE